VTANRARAVGTSSRLRHTGPVKLTALALVLALAGCAVRAAPPATTHPASPAAPIGRLAGPPASLRPGAVSYPDAPPAALSAAPAHTGHHQTP